MDYLQIISTIPRGQVRTTALGVLREKFPDPTVGGEEENNGIIRFDLKLPRATPIDRPRELWIDHAIVQETSPTYADDTLKYLESKSTNLPEESPAIQKIYGAKLRRYSALMDIVQQLAEERKLNFQPSFLFPVISSLGYMNGDMSKVLKFVVDCFKEVHSKLPKRMDGLSMGTLKGRFKLELKNSICFALIRGNSLVLNNQGVRGVVSPC